MIYRLLLCSILVLDCTSITAMWAAIEKEKNSVAALRESHEMLEGAREAQLHYYKQEVEALEKKLSEIRLQMPKALRMFQESVQSVKEKMSLSYQAYEQLIKSGFSSNSHYDEQSSELIKEHNDFIATHLNNPDMNRAFIVHSDFLRLCKSVKHTKSKVVTLEKVLETNNRYNEFSKNSRLSSIINTFEAELEAVKKQAESK